jgi:hypothetical protein
MYTEEEHRAEIAKWEKQAKDHHSAFTKSQMETKRIKAEADEYRARVEAKEVQAEMERIRSVYDDMPDWAKWSAAKEFRQLESRLAELQGGVKPEPKTQHGGNREEFMAAIIREVPDALALRDDPAFRAWVGEQPPIVQRALSDADANPADVVWALRQYKATNSGTALERQVVAEQDAARKAAAGAPKGGPSAPESQRTFTRAEIKRMSPAEFSKHREAILKAEDKGLIR